MPLPCSFLFLFFSNRQADGKSWNPAARIYQSNTGDDWTVREGSLRQNNFQFQTAQDRSRSKAGNRDGGQHGGQHDKQQVVIGVEGGDANDQGHAQISNALFGDLIIEGVPEASTGDTAGEIGNGCPAYSAGQQQGGTGKECGRSQIT